MHRRGSKCSPCDWLYSGQRLRGKPGTVPSTLFAVVLRRAFRFIWRNSFTSMLSYWLMALVRFVKLVLLGGSVKSMWTASLLLFTHRICHERSFSPARETVHKYLKFSLSLPRNLWVLGQLLHGLSPGEGALGWSFLVQSKGLTRVGYGLMERCFCLGRSEATLEGLQESICWPGGQGLLWSSLFPCSPQLYLCWGFLRVLTPSPWVEFNLYINDCKALCSLLLTLGLQLHIYLPVRYLPKTSVWSRTQSFPKPVSPMFPIAVKRTFFDPLANTRNLNSLRPPPWVESMVS